MDLKASEPPVVATIVVAVLGNVEALCGLVLALKRQTLASELFELVVVDNHPKAIVNKYQLAAAPYACRVVHEPRQGLSQARNTGIQQARGAFVLITDPDSRPESTWAQAMITALIDGDAFCAGGLTEPLLPERKALSSTVLPWFVPPAWPSRTQELHPPYWIVGCNLAFRRTEPISLFDVRLGVVGRRHLSCEDLEFVMRAQAAGKRVLVVPGAVVRRTVTLHDIGLLSMSRRAFWHGVSVARLLRGMPGAPILDSYRLRSAFRGRDPRGWLTHLARIAGFHSERIAEAVSRRRHPDTRKDPDRPTQEMVRNV